MQSTDFDQPIFPQITFDPETEGHLLNHPLTTDEIKECCKDIKVLGRKDIRNLVSWRKHLVAALLKEKEEEDKKNIVPVETKPEIKADSDSEDDLDEDEKDLETASKEIEAMQVIYQRARSLVFILTEVDQRFLEARSELM